MSFISLLVRFPASNNSYVIKLDNDMTVGDLCSQIRSKIREADVRNPSQYGIFITDPDPKHSFWLENSRMLSYYHLTDQFEVEYRFKMRLLVVQTMDGTRKTLQVDDSKTVAELMNTICAKMGITNHEEYSLLRPVDEEEKMRISTLKKKKNTDKDHDKLEKLKQKLHTDDDLNWLAHGKTLRQHGVEESDVLILKRKYFFADQNVDTRDPVQLNLLYLQLKEAILNGAHPISLEQAVHLAALQCQSEIGVLTDEKAKLNPVEVKDHLPKEYWKIKNVDKRIQEAHKKLGDFDERESKLRYIQLCRSLPTYGITFFLIKEKLKGRNKLVPRLFGVSKESVMRVDEKTKEILETWPLTRIRRWATGTNLFTLDFGDYDPDGNYAMKTTEGEQIGQLISGYIDIILRRQRSRQAALNDADDNNTIVEDNVAPSRANVIANVSNTLPRGHRPDESNIAISGTVGKASFHGGVSEGHLASRELALTEQNLNGANVGSGRIVHRNGLSTAAMNGKDQNFRVLDLPHPKRALLSRIDFGLRTIHEAAEELDTPIYSDDEALKGNDVVTKRWRAEALEQARHGVCSHLGAMTIATGQLVSCLQSTQSGQQSDEYDYTSMDASLVSIGMNVNSLMQCIRLYDQLETADNEGDTYYGACLKHAAQQLSDAFLDLVKAARPNVDSDKSSSLSQSTCSLVGNGPDRAALLEAAGQVGDASRQLLQLISQPSLASPVTNVEPTSPNDETQAFVTPLYPPVVDWEARDRLLSATKLVANRMADMVKLAKSGAMHLGQEVAKCNPNAAPVLRLAQSRLVHSATSAGKSASRLVTCAKVAVCTMEQPESQDQLIRAAKDVSTSANSVTEVVDELIRTSLDQSTMKNHIHESYLQLGDKLHEAVLAVHSGLNELLDCLRSSTVQAHQDPVICTLMSVATQLPGSVGDGLLLVDRATALASAASSLVAELRSESAMVSSQTGLTSSEAKRRADLLESEIHRLLTVAETCASGNSQSLDHQHMVVEAAQQLFTVAQATTAPIIRARLTQGLEFATRLTASNVGPLVTVGGEIVRMCQGDTHKLATNMEQLQKRVMPQVNLSCSGARIEPYNMQKQANLLEASQKLMQCLEDMLRMTDAVVPTIPDPGIQSAFSGAARNTQACLSDLRLCLNNYEPVLGSPPPDMQSDGQNNEIRTGTVDNSKKLLESLNSILLTETHRLLPGETLDSICVVLWNAVSRFNRSFPFFETASEDMDPKRDWNSLPSFIRRLSTADTGSLLLKDWTRVSSVVHELLERLTPLMDGIRGLAAFLTTASGASMLDSNLARVLLVSHGLVVKRQSTVSGRSSLTEPVHSAGLFFADPEEQAQTTAAHMLEQLRSIGESCLTDASQLITFALQPGPIDLHAEDTQQMVILSEQLHTSVNAVLGYVPGEVIVRRLVALLEDKLGISSHDRYFDPSSRGASDITSLNQPTSPESYSRLVSSARRLARVCLDAVNRISELGNYSTTPGDGHSNAFGEGSRVVALAYLADRISGAIAEVIRSASGMPDDNRVQTIEGLAQIGHPVAIGFRTTMRSVPIDDGRSNASGGENAAHGNSLQQALLKLRDWAIESAVDAENSLASATQPSAASDTNLSSWTVEAEDPAARASVRMRSQCEAAIRRVNALLQPSSPLDSADRSLSPHSASSALCSIRVPSTNQTFAECLDALYRITEDLNNQTESIPPAASIHDPDAFCAAVKAVAQDVCQLVQTTNQAAYLIGAAHPASKPGHIGPLAQSDQLTTLHDHIAAVRKGASELGRVDLPSTPDGLISLEVMNIATNVAQRATQLCQSTRPLLSDYKKPDDRRILAESLERVARTAAALFRATQIDHPTDSVGVSPRQLRLVAAQLEEAVDHYADVLIRSAGGSPTQLAEEALTLQTPILDCCQAVIVSSSQLLEISQHLVTQDSKQLATICEIYRQGLDKLRDSLEQLSHIIVQLVPGLEACEQVKANLVQLVAEIDETFLALTSADSPAPVDQSAYAISRLDTSLNLIRSTLQQLDQLTSNAMQNWDHAHWELLAHNIYSLGKYLPSLTKECVHSAYGLNNPSDQSGLLSLGRTVLEAAQQFIDCLANRLNCRSSHSFTAAETDLTVADYSNQLQQACTELLTRVDGIAKMQGGIAWHLASISTACAKLDDITLFNNEHSAKSQTGNNSLSATFVDAHARLGHQSRALLDAANRVTKAHATTNSAEPALRANAVAFMAQVFIQMIDTLQSVSSTLVEQGKTESTTALAQRLCHATQAVGAACSEFLRAPLHPDRFRTLSSRLDTLKAILQSCAPGADACSRAATNLSRLVADLDTAALFARTGTLAVSSDSPTTETPPASATVTAVPVSPKPRSFQATQETALHITKDLVDDVHALIKSVSSDHTALAVSAQNCYLRATTLTETVKCAASRVVQNRLTSEASTDLCVETQVQLLTTARDVVAGLGQLLNQSKSIAATRYVIENWADLVQQDELAVRQKALNDSAVRLVDLLARLSQAIRSLSSLIPAVKPTTPSPTLPAIVLPPKQPSTTNGSADAIRPQSHPENENSAERNSVRVGLESTLDVLKQIEHRFSSWTVEDRTLRRPVSHFDFDSNEQDNLGGKTTPHQLVLVSRSITQAAIKANSATASGKLSEIALSGQLVRKAAEDLLRVLPAACESALSSVPGELEDERLEGESVCLLDTVQAACRRAIAGAANTSSELQQMINHIIVSLDTGPSSPASVQVTLAMRRLRETVHDIVESAMNMPGANEASVEVAPAVSPKPFPVVLRSATRQFQPEATSPMPSTPTDRKISLTLSSKYQAEVEQSIADANATASEVSFPSEKELVDMAGELERNVHRIGQLHSKRAPSFRKTVRFTSSVDETEAPSSDATTPALVTGTGRSSPGAGASASIVDSTEGLDSVISACQHVVHTTLSLMYWAAAAQRELVQQGRLKPVDADPAGSESESQWSQGLISASRYVAAAANCVVESAQAMVAVRMNTLHGNDSEGMETSNAHEPKPEALISAAQTTAACTAQLIVACMAKADPSSKSCTGLRRAGAAVRQATENLVRLVQSFSSRKSRHFERSVHPVEGFTPGVVASMREVIETKSSIAAKQRELENLHTKLKHIHQDQYKAHDS